ncbi:MAG: dipeptidase, partial [Treponema sp.]|jgi:membrane dipeptidase|nr:dipeptidase [Treponema sp.]
MHCDTLMRAYLNKRDDIFETPFMLDIRRMREARGLAQFFAIFMPGPGAEIQSSAETFDDREYIQFCFDTLENTLKKHGGSIAPALSGTDIRENENQGKMSALLSFEDGRPIAGKIENLDHYHERGIRLISLTWNGENCFGFPNSGDPEVMHRGLKPFGKDAVRCMHELGMVVDVSHLSDGGFYDVAALSRKPFVASHSNCRALSPHQRNLSDQMIRTLADKGGVAGLNFCPRFLNADLEDQNSTAALISVHARHMIAVGGIECVALGSDFDGIEGTLEIAGVEQMPQLFDQLHRDGLTDDALEKIAWKNALRVLQDILG